MSAHAIKINLADGDHIFVGSKKRIVAMVTDAADAAAEPTQLKLVFTPDNAPATVTTYALTPTGSEVQLGETEAGTYYADHTFSVTGFWKIVATGSGNMTEVELARVYVDPV